MISRVGEKRPSELTRFPEPDSRRPAVASGPRPHAAKTNAAAGPTVAGPSVVSLRGGIRALRTTRLQRPVAFRQPMITLAVGSRSS